MSEDTITTDVKQDEGTKAEQNVPISRLNEVISARNELRDKVKAFETKEEEAKKAKLQEEDKWQELNAELVKEIDSYKPYKEKWESMNSKLREDALKRLPESKREKFKNLDTTDLLNVVEELSSKVNPPDGVGTIPPKKFEGDWTKLSPEDLRKNWASIVDSYKR